MSNIAFIDGQNLYVGTSKSSPIWHIELTRFRTYLKEKYSIEHAYFYLRYVETGDAYDRLYENIQKAGYILEFSEHISSMLGKKKGNVDSDIIFNAMKRLYLKELFAKIVLVSGDGDYKMFVEHLLAWLDMLRVSFIED